MAEKKKPAHREISDRPTPEEAEAYRARQPSSMGMPDGSLRDVLDRFITGRRKRSGPADFENP